MKPAMLGPHFYYDLIRLARKPRNYYLRCGYLTALLIGWWYVYKGSQPLGESINDHARLATNFTLALLAFQYVMILLLAPIYLAGTIVEERESRTLEMIYQTDLTDREILLGKFSARVVHLTLFGLMSLPMLAIISLWGGISVEFLVLNLAFSLLLILLVGSLCLAVSVWASSYLEAMLVAYAVEFFFGYLGAIPAVFAWEFARGGNPLSPSSLWAPLLIALMMLAGTCLFYFVALWHLRKLRNLNWVKRTKAPPRPLPRPTPKPKRSLQKRLRPTGRPIPDAALLWKETEHDRYTNDFPHLVLWIAVASVVVTGAINVISRLLVWPDLVGATMRLTSALAYVCMAGFTYLSFALQAASCVSHERERNTLDFLLLLPIARSQILFVKCIAPWIRHRVALLVMFTIPLVGMITGMFPARAALLMLILPWPSLLLVNTLGLFLSVVCARTMTANLLFVAILGLIVALHLIFWSEFALLMRGYSELFLADDLRRVRLEDDERRHAHWLIVGQQAVFLLLAMACGVLAFSRFGRQTAEASRRG